MLEITSALFSLVRWILCIEVLSIVAFPLFLRKSSEMSGFVLISISRMGGMVCLLGLLYVVSRIGTLPLSTMNTRVCFLIMVASGLSCFYFIPTRKSAWNMIVKCYWSSGAWFYSVFLIAYAISLHAPEIRGSERLMDMSFLTYFSFPRELPIEDVWAAGKASRYYYLGYLLIASLGKIAGTEPEITFHLARALIPALVVTLLMSTLSILSYIVRKQPMPLLFGFIMSIIIAFSVVPETFVQAFYSAEKEPFERFMSLCRILPGGIASETPLWSFLYGDLHPYIISYPFEIYALLLLLVLFLERSQLMITPVFLFGLTTILLLGVHTWSLIPIVILTSLLVMSRSWTLHGNFATFMKDARLIFLIGIFLVFPFILLYSDLLASGNSKVHYVDKSEHYTLIQLLAVYGHLLVPFVTLAVMHFFSFYKKENITTLTLLYALVIACFVYFLSQFAAVSFGVSMLLLLLGTLSLFLLFFSTEPHVRFSGAVGMSFFLMMLFWESIYYGTRSAFMARTYNLLHFAMGLAIFILLTVLYQKPRWKIPSSLCALFLSLYFLSTSGLTLFWGLHNPIYASTDFQYDGLKFLQSTPESALISWLRENATSKDILIEGSGASYSLAARISSYSGVPSVLGWENHVALRGIGKRAIERRARAIELIYNSPNVISAYHVAKKFGATFLVVSEYERKIYSAKSLLKFENAPSYFIPRVKKEMSVLYEVR